jgi:Secretion system C-terminal sorting domain
MNEQFKIRSYGYGELALLYFPNCNKNSASTPNCCGYNDNITIYPNPNTGQFTVQWSEVSDQWSVEIYNILGEKVYSQFIANRSSSIVNLNQPNGVYLIRILDKDGNLVSQKKVVKTN